MGHERVAWAIRAEADKVHRTVRPLSKPQALPLGSACGFLFPYAQAAGRSGAPWATNWGRSRRAFFVYFAPCVRAAEGVKSLTHQTDNIVNKR